MKFSELVQTLAIAPAETSLATHPDLDPDLHHAAAIQTASPGTISYIEGGKYAQYLATTQASAVILPPDADLQDQAIAQMLPWVSVPDPRLGFAQALGCFYQPFRPEPGIHPTAVIDPSAKIGDGVSIGAHVVIYPNVKIGDGVCILANVVICPDAHIGDLTVLHANCVIHERAQLGQDCVIQAGAVIGAEGFGFVPTPQGMVKMHQSGRVVLADGVEVGCNSTIDRPAVGETRIGRNTKLDNLVQIGHGCTIGQSCAMSAQAGMAGRCELGNGVLLAGQVGLSNDVKLGDGVIITAQSGVMRDVPSGKIMSGTPAMANKTWLKVHALLGRFPELYKTVRRLSQER